jgi:hypothetical protein
VLALIIINESVPTIPGGIYWDLIEALLHHWI